MILSLPGLLFLAACFAKGMPAFAEVLTEDDAQAIRAYVIRQGRLTLESAER